ncbi:MAG: glutamyl-tRNA reductase [Planctomycetes bacterium]|nr:glutamyl-tRNA reductase [Planctomycetota bacterium]
MRILCAGISHKTAGLSIREKLAIDLQEVRRSIRDLKRRWPAAQFVLLATCNRTELYCARPVHDHPREQELTQWLGELGELSALQCEKCVYMLADAHAVGHIFRVACGLESMVMGEDQIVSQIKQAYTAAVAAGAVGPVMHDIFQDALHAAKHVRSETAVARGKASVASVAVDCVLRNAGRLAGRKVLNVGAGPMNELMLRRLADLGWREIIVTNRNAAKARRLAQTAGGSASPFNQLDRQLAGADVVLTSTASPNPIITARMLASAISARPARPMLVIDIAVPRDVEEAAREIPGVRLFNIDDLDRLVNRTLKTRKTALAQADGLIEHHVAKLMQAMHIRFVAPTIADLFRHVEAISDEQLAEAMNKFASHEDRHADEAILRRTVHRTVRRILDPLARNLRASESGDAARSYVAAVRKLFELDNR